MTARRAAMSLAAAGDRVVAEYAEGLRVLASEGPIEVVGSPRLGLLAWVWDGPLRLCVSCRTEVETLSRVLRCPDCGSAGPRPVWW